ncbi:unnamed protein product [Echinostoma caproni]|uniref:CUB domain-containing protein n=1 Tax=Echinostoma caproni TaxID=27848 RepID=A0A3P8BMZ3_9TREM|nr:unnamed protein product [Echinostoma caproni]
MTINSDDFATTTFTATITEVGGGSGTDECGTTDLKISDLASGWKVPQSAFTKKLTCTYTLTGDAGKTYEFAFTDFKVGTEANPCGQDYVEVSNKADFSENPGYKKCGQSPPADKFSSTSNVFYVKLVVGSNDFAKTRFAAEIKSECCFFIVHPPDFLPLHRVSPPEVLRFWSSDYRFLHRFR